MQKSISLAGIAAALVLITGCANQKHWTSPLSEDSPQTTGGVRVANETPGSQGPVADNSRLAINHRDVARREALARERLARDAEARRRTQVTDNTYTRSSAPEAPVAAPERAPAPKKARVHAVSHSKKARVRHASEGLRRLNRDVALNELHHINQKEIALAKLASSNARSSELKATAERIRRDHERLEAKVEELAKSREVKLASFTAATHEGVRMDRLEKLTGREFDAAFAQTMKDGHKLTAAQLRILRPRVSDPAVLALIDQTIPKVRQHEQRSGNLLGTIKTGNDYSARR